MNLKIVGFDGGACRRLADDRAPRQPDPGPAERDTNVAANEAQGREQQEQGFDPDDIFYEAPTAKYYVGRRGPYRVYTRKTPVVHGIAKHLKRVDPERNDANDRAKDIIAEIEVEHAVDWAGSIAGHQPGLCRLRSSSLLVTEGPRLVDPVPGEWRLIENLLIQALGEGVQMDVFLGWLSIALKAVRAGSHQPGQMMCLAGVVNAGKTLIAKVAGAVLGGRSANPHTAWTGSLIWNDDIVGSELLVIDDCESSIDIRSRRKLAASFKEANYSNEIQMRKRHTSSISVRPVWRVIVCCNDNPEALQIIPPIDDDLSDKVILMRVSKIDLPVDTSSPEGRKRFWSMIEGELPAFVDFLLGYEVPKDLRDSRAGVMAYRDPDLEEAVIEISSERVFEELIIRCFEAGELNAYPGETVSFTASDLQGRLTSNDSPVSKQAHSLFTGWPARCGVLLGKLAKQRPNLVAKGKTINGVHHWSLTRPGRNSAERVEQ